MSQNWVPQDHKSLPPTGRWCKEHRLPLGSTTQKCWGLMGFHVEWDLMEYIYMIIYIYYMIYDILYIIYIYMN